MCTLTYIPQENGFVIGNSRDVEAERGNAVPPKQYTLADGSFAIYPKDQQSGGTWFATSEKGFTVCLLNGGFEKHIRKSNYAKSRGNIPLDFLAIGNIEAFINEYNFAGIEPFTLVVFNHNTKAISDLVWTGNELVRHDYLNNEPLIWSSSTLYNLADRAERANWFKQHLQYTQYQTDKLEVLKKFHFEGGASNPNEAVRIKSFRTNGPITVSISLLQFSDSEWVMHYDNLLDTKNQLVRLYV
jgi:uncharacterized protein with NRDE domain